MKTLTQSATNTDWLLQSGVGVGAGLDLLNTSAHFSGSLGNGTARINLITPDFHDNAAAGVPFQRASAKDMLQAPLEIELPVTQFETVRVALADGDVTTARRLIDEILALNPSVASTEEWAQLNDADSWPDGWLLAAVRRDPPDEAALDALVRRHWDSVFSRCRMLTLNHEKAWDLAQATWCRLLRTRHALKPDGNFPAYVNTIATNLFRDSYRAARRAGPMADHRLESLDAPHSSADGDTVALLDNLPDLKSLQSEEQTLLAMDIDEALARLTPQLREVLVARFIDGESCAEIGRRYGRTEQSVSGWVREALRRMKGHLEESNTTFDCQSKGSKRDSSASRSRSLAVA